MDPSKKRTLVKWLDALCKAKIDSFDSLLDGVHILSILRSIEDNQIPDESCLTSVRERFDAVRVYLEGFYQQPLANSSLLKFEVLIQRNASREILDLEMGKLVLALLGGLIQEKCREKFIQPALTMDQVSQHEMKEMIESILFTTNDMDTRLPEDFAAVLKRKSVADGLTTSTAEQSTPDPAPVSGPSATMFSYSPQAGGSHMSIRDISSPLRGLSLSSPGTPLMALMQSPQLAQKAMMRQKVQEVKRLEHALEEEKHLRSELEYDMQDRSHRMEQKDARLRELEHQLSQVRTLRDQIDELEPLRCENEQLHKDLSRLQGRVRELQDMKEHWQAVSVENREALEDLHKAKEEVKMLQSVNARSEEYQVMCHKQQFDLCETRAMVEHREQELQQLRTSYEELQNMHQVVRQQCTSLRQEKEELEELMATSNTNGMMEPRFSGESMSIVTDKRISELQTECDLMKSTWIEPSEFHKVQKQLEQETQAKTTFEENYFEIKKKLLCSDGEVERLTNTVRQYEGDVAGLETSVKEVQAREHALHAQNQTLQARLEQLQTYETELAAVKETSENKISDLQKDVSRLQSELQLTQRELEVQLDASETRRMTIIQLDSDSLNKEKEKQRLSADLDSWKTKAEEQEDKNRQMKDANENLKTKLLSASNTLSETETKLENERVENAAVVKDLKEKVLELQDESKEMEEKVSAERQSFKAAREELEEKVQTERSESEKRLKVMKSLTAELEELRSASSKKEESLTADLESVSSQKKQLDLDVHRLKLELQSVTDNLTSRCQKLETKYKESRAAAAEEISGLQGKNKDREGRVRDLKEQVTGLEADIRQQKEENEKLRKTIELLKSNTTAVGDSLEKSKLTVVDLQIQLKTANDKYENEKEHSGIIVMEKDRVIGDLKSKLETLMTAYNDEKSDLSQKLRYLDQALTRKSEEFLTQKENYESKIQSIGTENEKRIENLTKEHSCVVRSLECKIESIEETACETRKSLQRQIESFELKIAEKEAAAEKAEADWKSVLKEKNEKISAMEEKLDYLKDNERVLQAAYTVSRADIDAMKNLIKERDEVKEKSDVIIKEKDKQIHQLESTVSSLEETVQCVNSELSGNQTVLSQTQGERSELQARLCSLEEEREKLQTQVTSLQAGLESQAQVNHSTAQELKDHFTQKLAKEQQNNAELVRTIEACKSESEKMEADLMKRLEASEEGKVEVEKTLAELKSQLESNQSEYANQMAETEHYWRSQLEALEEEYNQATEEQKALNANLLSEQESKFESQLEQLSDEKDLFISGETQAYRERIAGLEKVIAERRQELQEALDQLEEQKTSAETMSNTLGEQLATVEAALAEKADRHREALTELSETQEKLKTVEENRQKEVEDLIGQYETQLDSLRQELSSAHEETVAKLQAGYQTEVVRLRAEVEEEKTACQTRLSEVHENLTTQDSSFKERLSQMRCQYEATIENNRKEHRAGVREFEQKLSVLGSEKQALEEKLQVLESLRESLSSEQQEKASLETQLSHVQDKNSELTVALVNVQEQSKTLESQLASSAERTGSLEQELGVVQEQSKALESQLATSVERTGSLEQELGRVQEELGQVKGEKYEVEMQLRCIQERTDTLTGELSSQQQQLAAVEEEKRVLELERGRLVERQEQMNQDFRCQADTQFKFLELEKVELERQLQSSQKCYETVQKSETELERRNEKLEAERAHLERRCQELEQRVYTAMDKETKLKQEMQQHTDKAIEYSGVLRRQLDEKIRECNTISAESSDLREKLQNEVKSLSEALQTRDQQLASVNKNLEAATTARQKVEAKQSAILSNNQKLQETIDKYNIHYNQKKEIIANLTKEQEKSKKLIEKLTRSEGILKSEVNPLREKLEGEVAKNKALAEKVNKLEVQVDLADRKIREYRGELEKGGSVFLGDNSHFMKMISSRENPVDASFMENHPATVMDDSLESHTGYKLRSQDSSQDSMTSSSLSEETLTPGTRASRSRKRISHSISSTNVNNNEMTPGAASIGSASSLAYRLRSRESAVSLNRSFSSVDSCKSSSSVPRGTGGIFFCEDEPTELLEFGRLGELQRRNTLCLPHLKTSYPVETQTFKPKEFSDRALRESTMGNETIMAATTNSGKKRKMERDRSISTSSTDSKSKHAKVGLLGTVYNRPGPPTPGKTRRNSGKGSKSPKTPGSNQSKRSFKLTSRRTPKKQGRNVSTPGSAKKATRRESVAFNIGFSPQASGKRLTRQQGFIQKQPQSSGQVSRVVSMFEQQQSTPLSNQVTPVSWKTLLNTSSCDSASKTVSTTCVASSTSTSSPVLSVFGGTCRNVGGSVPCKRRVNTLPNASLVARQGRPPRTPVRPHVRNINLPLARPFNTGLSRSDSVDSFSAFISGNSIAKSVSVDSLSVCSEDIVPRTHAAAVSPALNKPSSSASVKLLRCPMSASTQTRASKAQHQATTDNHRMNHTGASAGKAPTVSGPCRSLFVTPVKSASAVDMQSVRKSPVPVSKSSASHGDLQLGVGLQSSSLLSTPSHHLDSMFTVESNVIETATNGIANLHIRKPPRKSLFLKSPSAARKLRKSAMSLSVPSTRSPQTSSPVSSVRTPQSRKCKRSVTQPKIHMATSSPVASSAFQLPPKLVKESGTFKLTGTPLKQHSISIQTQTKARVTPIKKVGKLVTKLVRTPKSLRRIRPEQHENPEEQTLF